MSDPETKTMTFSVRTRDIEQFAKIHMGIELMPYQLHMIDHIAKGKTFTFGRRAGYTTAKKVLQSYVQQEDGFIKHFERTHFLGMTMDKKPFVYCPIGNIISWSEGDFKHQWCEYCKKTFKEIKQS